MKISNVARSAMCDALVDLIDGGAGAGTLLIFTGAAPANTTDGDSGTLLATLTFSDPAYGSASSGVAQESSITSDSSIDATGTAQHFRIKDSNGVVIMQGSVGTSASDINFNSVSFQTGGTCAVTDLPVTVPAGT